MNTPFVKMHGIGNDFVVLDAFAFPQLPSDLVSFSCQVSDRRRGIGSDGLLVLEKGEGAPIRMRMWNPDGSVSEMCGNGLRCVVKLAHDRGYFIGDETDVETDAGVLHAEVLSTGLVRIDMGLFRVVPSEIPINYEGKYFINQPIGDNLRGSAISMGNPHLVILVPDVAAVDLETLGPKFESLPMFPNKTNVHFVQVVSRTHLIQRTWERGAGVTLACGTGACACGVAAFLVGESERGVTIDLPGGKLEIEVGTDNHVWMTGPTQTVFDGLVETLEEQRSTSQVD